MVFLAIPFFICNFLIGVIVVNRFLFILPRLAKCSASFFLGIYISTLLVFITAMLLKNTHDALQRSLITILIIQVFLISVLFVKRHSLFVISLSIFEIILLILFFCFGWYCMQKGFSYANNSFYIASNLYLDFGSHIPIIRSFSEGNNFPPSFPFYARVPLVYHFFYDFLIAMYEKLGMRIDYAFNLLSALSFAGVMSLLFSLSQELFANKKLIGILAVLLFVFNSSLSFVYGLEKYYGKQLLSNLYHHNVYLGNGPFGESIVSIFWNLNTYVNQRHFLFSLGLILIIMHVFYYSLIKKKYNIPWFFLSWVVGTLPFWHTSVFLAVISMAVAITGVLFYLKLKWRKMLFFIIFAFLIALPQIYFIKQYQSVPFSFFNPGFLVAKTLNITMFATYWLYNLGFSIIMIPIGVLLAKKQEKLFFILIAILFLLPNIFQFSPQMFDNHKFFNMFILLANIYTAYVLYVLFSKRLIFKIIAVFLLFLLTFSGIIDFFVIKNDIKSQIADYPNNKFLLWVKQHTDPNAVFLTNSEIYDPITFVGRKSFIGRPHYLFAYGVNPEERQKVKTEILSSEDVKHSIKLLKMYNITYVVLYKKKHTLDRELKTVYKDDTHEVLQVI